MRFEVDFQLNSQEIPKDKNKLFASWMKFFMKKYDDVMFDKLYNSGAVTKNYTYSVFLGTDVVFKQESIKLSSDRIKLFFTCYDMRESLAFYNIFTRARNEEYNYKNLIIKATSINVEKNIIFKSNQECFKTMSPSRFPGPVLALWEDRSRGRAGCAQRLPHDSVVLVGPMRGGRRNDPPGAPEPGPSAAAARRGTKL